MFQSVIKVSCAGLTLVSAHALAAGTVDGSGQGGDVRGVSRVDGNSAVPTFPKVAGLGHKYLLKPFWTSETVDARWR